MATGSPSVVEQPVWIEKVVPLASEQTGVFYPLVRRGTYVQQGMKVGYVTDYLGKTIFEARAPAQPVVQGVLAAVELAEDVLAAQRLGLA